MSSVIASRRYALALLSAAEEGMFLDQATEALNSIKETLDLSRDLVHVLRSPLINGDQKKHILEEVFRNVADEKVMIFLRLLAQKKRAGLLQQIILEFQKLLDEKNGIINIDIASAVKFSDEQEKELVNRLSAYTGKNVRPKTTIKEDLLGGITIKIGDTILDGSVKHQLHLMKQALTSGKI
ncbi:MAG: F0F1 ATP synthase subunit delta [Chlorobium sp.]|jgi:F-type H+-transporting ATPase subunit delta|uniref:ATP synthase F1 subunit delta n=1 Tax=Chlorobium sp. TaxID=1095 RepID=UPI001D85A174|nr:ATP synthase F1 subunit delta [Chlorobium sp.]MBN1279012.1 F0F1 ATP synthase subunit delta [Chlorobiaceae bacterium]MCF8217115.1 F0F1 ATP synthase subunit delta [Chlorobium sp.]MCF8271961.1 F0F1 ATP synthase subunit delta [Chlorobium sp.]MCF8288332.1 F0F1 ATP synthase subunit delta [Chlorobium sp.]MCF8291923.1 F0F1 ATP synthase subunit delta [Chlorobium sp.]